MKACTTLLFPSKGSTHMNDIWTLIFLVDKTIKKTKILVNNLNVCALFVII